MTVCRAKKVTSITTTRTRTSTSKNTTAARRKHNKGKYFSHANGCPILKKFFNNISVPFYQAMEGLFTKMTKDFTSSNSEKFAIVDDKLAIYEKILSSHDREMAEMKKAQLHIEERVEVLMGVLDVGQRQNMR